MNVRSNFLLPPELLTSPEVIQEALRQTKAKRQELELDRVRADADLIRARCQSFAEFVKAAWHVPEPQTELVWGWHLQAMCDHLEAISRGQLHPRMIINVAPGSSKSTIVSVMWQAWEWGPLDRPGTRYISTSYEGSVATRDSRKSRDLIMSEWYQALWPLNLTRRSEDSFANGAFGTRDAIAFSSITGKRGDRFTIDDPHSLDGAESEADRERAVRRFIEGGQNRLNDQERSAIVIVMQRLHEADLTGALLARELGYIHLCIPMEYEPERQCISYDKAGNEFWRDPRGYDGELMDPARMPRREVELLKKDNEYMWAGQYQQRPAPREGGMFKIGKLVLVDSVPMGAVRVRGWDIAGSTRKRSPFTVGAQLAWDGQAVYIADVKRERLEIDRAEALIVDTAHQDGRPIHQSIPQDPGSAGKSQKLHISNKLAGLDFVITTETGAKEDRAIPFAAMVNAGSVRMVKASWNQALLNELELFPGSAYKDQVDALSRAFQALARYMTAPRRVPAGPLFVGPRDY